MTPTKNINDKVWFQTWLYFEATTPTNKINIVTYFENITVE